MSRCARCGTQLGKEEITMCGDCSAKNMRERDQILAALDYHTVTLPDKGDEGWTRATRFIVGGNEYKIVWFWNVSTLHFPCGSEVKFYGVERTNTWPNAAKMNLQFKDKAGDTFCIMPIESYEQIREDR